MSASGNAPAPATSNIMPQVPISLLANISYKTGPPSIRNENGQLVGFVFVDITSSDIEGYVRARRPAHQRAGQVSPWFTTSNGRDSLNISRPRKSGSRSSCPLPCSSSLCSST